MSNISGHVMRLVPQYLSMWKFFIIGNDYTNQMLILHQKNITPLL